MDATGPNFYNGQLSNTLQWLSLSNNWARGNGLLEWYNQHFHNNYTVSDWSILNVFIQAGIDVATAQATFDEIALFRAHYSPSNTLGAFQILQQQFNYYLDRQTGHQTGFTENPSGSRFTGNTSGVRFAYTDGTPTRPRHNPFSFNRPSSPVPEPDSYPPPFQEAQQPVRLTCGDTRGDGSNVVFDCSGNPRNISANPGNIRCAGIRCTPRECCTVDPPPRPRPRPRPQPQQPQQAAQPPRGTCTAGDYYLDQPLNNKYEWDDLHKQWLNTGTQTRIQPCIKPDGSPDKKKYYKQMLKYHPDKNPQCTSFAKNLVDELGNTQGCKEFAMGSTGGQRSLRDHLSRKKKHKKSLRRKKRSNQRSKKKSKKSQKKSKKIKKK